MTKRTGLKRCLIGGGVSLVGLITLLMRKQTYMGIVSLFLLLCGICFLLLTLLRMMASKKIWRVCSILFHTITSLLLVSFLITEGLVITAAVKANRAESVLPGDIDTIVVPGAGMNGTTPSLLFALRLRRAYALMESAPNSRVVVCGGQGDNEAITEADCGKAYLIALGADPERIFTEVQSRDTYENLKYFCALFPAETKIALVSNDFHIYRCNLLAKRNGLEAVLYSAPTPYLYLKLNYFPREYISLVIARIEALGITIDTSNFHLAYSANSAVY